MEYEAAIMNLALFYSLPVEDQNQYFGKTYFKVFDIREQKPCWGWCVGFEEQNWAKFSRAQNKLTETINLVENSPDFLFPRVGLYNLGNTSVYFQKIPKRQSKKGLCSETAKFTPFQNLFFDREGNGKIPGKILEIWKIKVIKEMFDNSGEYSLAFSMDIFQRRRPISFAMTRNFGLSLGINSKFLNLWYKQILVGIVPSPREIVLIPDCMFKQEVVDHFHLENIQISEEKIALWA